MSPFSTARGLTSEGRVSREDEQQTNCRDVNCLLVFFQATRISHSNAFTSLCACMDRQGAEHIQSAWSGTSVPM